jgi:hypothetical protein
VPRPLVATPCEPPPAPNTMGYAAALAQVGPRLRLHMRRGRRELVAFKLSRAQRALVRRPGEAIRFVVTVRNASGARVVTRSPQFTLE